jgi:transcriptional regulator GlxA family with amidase domain
MKQQTIHMFVFDALADWEPGFAIAGLNNPAWQAQPGRYRVATVGVSKAPIVTIGGVAILPDLALDELTPEHSAMLDQAKRFLAAGVPVAAICGATAGLARAGILDDIQHTSNAREYLQTTGYQGAALYQDQPAVVDGNVITASSTAPIEFAYQIFKKLDVYSDEALEAWFGLFKTGDATYYGALTQQTTA